MYKVLIVEDELDIGNLLAINLEAEGYKALQAVNGEEGLETARREKPDFIVLDLMLPGMDGLKVCKALKAESSTAAIPVLMLTARGEEVDRVVGFELGADDYVVKPFSVREVLLRIRAILNRKTDQAEGAYTVYQGLSVDTEAMLATVDGKDMQLTATEFRLLAHLIQNKGRVLSREHLLDRVWGYEFEGYARTVDTHVRRLRVKLGPYAGFIHTVRGIGYRFSPEEDN
ncbi:MAG: winged helix-turn-helix domain-containing protein [Desulfonatronovibrionaceae bacterium]